MAEPAIHFAVPFAAFTALGLKPELAFLLSLLALTPDLDVLLHYHRSITHSLIPWIIITMPLLALNWESGSVNVIILALLALTSHILLDLTGYTPILYPIVKDSYRINVNFNMHLGSSPNFKFNLKVMSRPTTFKPIERLDAKLFTGEGLLISLILLAPTLLSILKRI